MIFHCSIGAKDPEHVAKVIAELWNGEALEFLPANNGSWMALAKDDRGSMIEVYPSGNLLSRNGFVGDPDPTGGALTATHVAMATTLSTKEVYAIGEREGWEARPRRRRMGFDVIELWVENHVMLEVLTAEMQQEYLTANTAPRWHAAMAAAKAALAAAEADAPRM